MMAKAKGCPHPEPGRGKSGTQQGTCHWQLAVTDRHDAQAARELGYHNLIGLLNEPTEEVRRSLQSICDEINQRAGTKRWANKKISVTERLARGSLVYRDLLDPDYIRRGVLEPSG